MKITELIDTLRFALKYLGDREVIILTSTGEAQSIFEIKYYAPDQTVRISTE